MLFYIYTVSYLYFKVICDWDVQCHHLHTDMVCKTPSERDVTVSRSNKRCVCSDISLRDPDNGLCTQVCSPVYTCPAQL